MAVLLLGVPTAAECRETAAWYWANTVDREKMEGLLTSDASCVFIKAGYWERADGGLVFRGTRMSGFRAPPAAGPSVHLVFPFTAGPKEDLRRLSESLPGAVERSVREFRARGFAVAGVQFDVEGDVTAEEYLGLIRAAGPALDGMELSACFFPSMLEDRVSAALMKELDFVCVMFYDLSYDSADYRITDADWINRVANGPLTRGKPFFAGLPVYGCITVFDAAGRLVHPRVDFPDFSVFSSDSVRLLGPGTAGLRRYRVEKAFSYKQLSFRPGMLLYLYDPGAAEVRALTDRVAIGAPGFRGFSYFSCPMTKKAAFTFADFTALLAGGSRRY